MALSQLGLLTTEESPVTTQTALKTTDILSRIVTPTSSEHKLQEILQIESNLLPKTGEGNSEGVQVGNSIKGAIDQIISNTIQSRETI